MSTTDNEGEKMFTPTVKAYKNPNFINSDQARHIRIMCEYEETMIRLKKNNIKASVLFFGSARAKNGEEWEAEVAKAKAEVAAAADDDSLKAAQKKLKKWEKCEWMGECAEKITELSRLVTEWAVSPRCHLGRQHSYSGVTRYHFLDPRFKGDPRYKGLDGPHKESLNISDSGRVREQHLVVCTGGGPGFMEAASKGASKVPGAKNMGMGISLPFEAGLNKYVTEELAFEYHYFFTRKFWMVYHCQALVVAPGGFGTLDELFEVLTLKQTGKVQNNLTVVLFGKVYWQTIINWQALVDYGTIAQEDVDQLFFTDEPEEAFHHLVKCLSANENNI
ncbi:unnamed protein product [Choristocarpus tenellus]